MHLGVPCVIFLLPVLTSSLNLTVHLVPHSHDDVGWTETIDEYYSSRVQSIYDTVTDSLAVNPSRRFISVEQAFVHKWYTDPTTQGARLSQWDEAIHTGQVELVLGGWVMHDECVSYYEDNINQMTLGHRFIQDTWGDKASPRQGWQIDPFGSSALTAPHFQMMGFDATVTNRINYELKNTWMEQQRLVMNWTGSASLAEYPLLAHVMDSYGYCCPDNPRNIYYWDDTNYWGPGGEPALNTSTTPTFASRMIDTIMQRAQWFKGSHLLFPWGCDFEFHNAYQMYESMDQVVAYINSRTDVSIKVVYSTLSDYFSALSSSTEDHRPSKQEGGGDRQADLSYPAFTGEFLPYIDAPGRYWTGFYASRSHLKGLIAASSALLRAVEMAYALALGVAAPTVPPIRNASGNESQSYENLVSLRRAVAECQHHDAVPGTAKPPVVQMYRDNLLSGSDNASHMYTAAMSSLFALGNGSGPPLSTSDTNFLTALRLSPIGHVVPLCVHNSLGWSRVAVVNVTLPEGARVEVVDSNNQSLRQELVSPLPATFCNKSATTPHWWCQYTLFVEVSLAPLGTSTIFLRRVETSPLVMWTELPSTGQAKLDTPTLEVQVGLTGTAGEARLETYNRRDGVKDTVVHQLRVYHSASNNSQSTPQKGVTSDPYIFRPLGASLPYPEAPAPASRLLAAEGVFVRCAAVVDSLSPVQLRVFRVFNSNTSSSAGMDAFVHIGPLQKNRELVVRLVSSLATNGSWLTDSNGYQTQRRTWNSSIGLSGGVVDQGLQIAGNYYPSVASASICDEGSQSSPPARQWTVLFDRAHGVTSVSSGYLETMIHRRLWVTDAEGNYSPGTIPLNDTTVLAVHSRHLFGDRVSVVDQHHSAALQMRNPPRLLFAASPQALPSVSTWTASYRTESVAMNQSLPHNVHLLSLQALEIDKRDVLVLRLAHTFAVNESSTWSIPVQIDLRTLFPALQVESVTETSLTTMFPKDAPVNLTAVELSPLHIRTFLLALAKR